MSTFLAILKNDLTIISKDIKALLLLLLMPILVILIFAKALGPFMEKNVFVEPFNMVLVDKESSLWTGLLTTQLKSLGMTKDIINTTEEKAEKLIANGEVAAAIVIPENLSDSVDHWSPEQGKVLGSSRLYLEAQLVKNVALVGSTAVSSGLAALNTIYDFEQKAGFDDQTLYNDMVKANEAFINVILARRDVFRETRYERNEIDPIAFYAASLIAIFIMFSSIPCIKMMAQERQMGILSRIQATPSKSWQLVGSKIIVSVLISLTQFAIISGFLLIALKDQIQAPIGPLLMVFFATALASGAFSLLIASFATSLASIDLVANLSILLMAITGGSIYPLSSLPEASKIFSSITINRWSAEAFIMAFTGDGFEAMQKSIGILLVLALGYLTAALLIMGLRRRQVAS